MRLCAISDIHGQLPEIPPCDVLTIAGDISLGFAMENANWTWWSNDLRNWLIELNKRGILIVGVAGNHDFILQGHLDKVKSLNLPWIYLEDSGVEIMGLNLFGTPWQPWFGGWAFNAPEIDPGEEFLESKFSLIPEGADVIISHGPPAGILDEPRPGEHVGSIALNRAIQRVMPQLNIFGHIHNCYGVEEINGVTLANVSQVDSRYKLSNQPICFDL